MVLTMSAFSHILSLQRHFLNIFLQYPYMIQYLCPMQLNNYGNAHNNHHKSFQQFNQELQYLQNDITQFQNKFLRFKIVSSQLTNFTNQENTLILAQISGKIKEIHYELYGFINKFQKQLSETQHRMTMIVQNYLTCKNERFIERQSRKCQQKDEMNQTLKRFEKRLKQHEDKEQKLIRTIGTLLAKYNKHEDLHIIQNHAELKNKIMMSQVQQVNQNYGMKNHFYGQQQRQVNRPKLSIYQTIQKQRNLSFQKQYNTDTIIRSQPPLQFKKALKQNFCGKISLKGVCGLQRRQKSPLFPGNSMHRMTRQNSLHKQRRSESTQTHNHRFLTMIKKLHQ